LQKEEIAIKNGYTKIAVIAGVGVREYYRKLGYIEDSKIGCYQIKYLIPNVLTTKLQNPTIYDNLKIGILLRLFYIIIIVIIAFLLNYFSKFYF
jgi:hypothetical protein